MLFALNDALQKTTKNKLWTESLLLSRLDEFLKRYILEQYGENCEDMKLSLAIAGMRLDVRLKCSNIGLLTSLKLDQFNLQKAIRENLQTLQSAPKFDTIKLTFNIK